MNKDIMRKVIGILICTLLIVSAVLSASGIAINEKAKMEEQKIATEESSTDIGDSVDWWPQFQHDPENIGYSTSTAPNTKNILWTYIGEEEGGFSSTVVVDNRVYAGSWGWVQNHDHGWGYLSPGDEIPVQVSPSGYYTTSFIDKVSLATLSESQIINY